MHFCATFLFWILGSSDMSYMVLLEKLMVRKYIWLNLFNVSLRTVGEQPCVCLRGGQCFSPQKIPSFIAVIIVIQDLHTALVACGLNPMEQEVIDMTNEVARSVAQFYSAPSLSTSSGTDSSSSPSSARSSSASSARTTSTPSGPQCSR